MVGTHSSRDSRSAMDIHQYNDWLSYISFLIFAAIHASRCRYVVMVALWNRTDRYIYGRPT